MQALKIVGMCFTFVVCTILGYHIPVDKIFSSGGEIDIKGDDDIIAINSGGGKIDDAWPLPESDESGENIPVVDDAQEQPVEENITEATEPTETAQSSENNKPIIESAYVLGRDSKNYKKVGLNCIAKASVPSGDNLLFQLCEVGSDTPKYKSNNGLFYDINPVDGGVYTLIVKNERTGDETKKDVKGFDKIQRLTATTLQTMLNADNQDRLFYFHFDVAKLRFDCSGVDAADVPQTLDALLASRAAFGWKIEVVGTPQYDDYNRITYFKINLSV